MLFCCGSTHNTKGLAHIPYLIIIDQILLDYPLQIFLLCHQSSAYVWDFMETRKYLGQRETDMTQLLLLGKVEYGGGPIFKVVLEC